MFFFFLLGNCTFDKPSLCSWSNDKHTDHFDWLLRQGSTPGNTKGPASDHSGHESQFNEVICIKGVMGSCNSLSK